MCRLDQKVGCVRASTLILPQPKQEWDDSNPESHSNKQPKAASCLPRAEDRRWICVKSKWFHSNETVKRVSLRKQSLFFFHRIHLFLVLSYVTKPSVSCRYPAVQQTGDRLRLRCGCWKWNTIPQNPQSAIAKKAAAARRRWQAQVVKLFPSTRRVCLHDSETATLQHPFHSLRLDTKYECLQSLRSDSVRFLPHCAAGVPTSFIHCAVALWKTSTNEMALVKSRSRRVKLSLWVPAARQKTNARPSLSRIARELLKLPSFAWGISGEESRRLTEVAFVTGDNEISAPLHSVWLRVGIRFHRNLSLISFFFMVTTKSHKSNQFISDF